MTAPACRICGLQVWPDGPDNVLSTQAGDRNCHPPFYVVRDTRRNVAIETIFRDRGGLTARQRALAAAARNPDYKVKRISPHGHQVK